ncbi:tRNA preQ1(34) S-adenosylmethionine ribosyltransferase-isomerase QueA [Salidesulfovibrio brasiliensis]|uniref:tRNA preQ1(34) S-adenosylmethionine ribosyltransferase-isomerase QueA n=1 Tax=Salidesulfovibrio brasiliensis TaxID=221711 RepID=UPI0006CFAE4E|nr:tRNA preQ1(34) S-adenosylmethionine ribosyltransferase-isomerase QueA [Salidesulfovibrio brasiliensis]
MKKIPRQYNLNTYNFELPEERIAQQPADRRDGSRLLVLDRDTGNRTIAPFSELGRHLPENALLVVNNSRVFPARMFGTKPTGGKVEFLLLTPLPRIICTEGSCEWKKARVQGLLRSSKSPRPHELITFSDDFKLVPRERGDFGKWVVDIEWHGDLEEIIGRIGCIPLPPYIGRDSDETDAERYQTTYCRKDKAGSVAAPTAGLHFTPELRKELEDAGHDWAEVTLYVGYGTFSPVRERDIRKHAMHSEFIEVGEETVQAVKKAKSEGRPVVAIGTTSARALEGMVKEAGKIEEFRGETDIFITPGYTFKVVDCLLTNFHLPESSLIIMVSALAGIDTIKEAYRDALDNGFRFFSYGDAMLIR